MPFLVFLKSFEELLYELMSWLVFYPRTLWRAVRHPLAMMARSEHELELPAAEQFKDMLSPPIFLLLTIIVAHGLEIAFVGNSPLIGKDDGLAGLISDNTSLLIFRIVAFASVPIIVAAFAMRVLGRPMDRATLQPVFYAQCFVTTPVVLVYSLASTVARLTTSQGDIVVEAMVLAATVVYFCVEASWFSHELKRGWFRGAVCAVGVFVISGILLIAGAWLFTD